MDKQDIGMRLKKFREQRGLTQEEFAYELGVETNLYREYETGKRYPSDASFKSLYEAYNMTEDDLFKEDLYDVSKRKKIFDYVQIGMVSFFILLYALPFYDRYDTGMTTGFESLFIDAYPFTTGMFFSFIGLLVLLVLVRKYKWSSLYKSVGVLVGVTGMTLFTLELEIGSPAGLTLVLFQIFLFIYVFIALFDMVKHPVEHDSLIDKERVRKILIFVFNIVLFIIFVNVLRNTLLYEGYTSEPEEFTLLILWGIYHLCYFVTGLLKPDWLETRIKASLWIVVPTLVFIVFFMYAMIANDLDDYDTIIFIAGLMLMPVFAMNLDVIISILKGEFLVQE